MPKYDVNYFIDDARFSYCVEGDLAPPKDICLILGDDDLTKDLPWHAQGYSTAEVWDQKTFALLRAAVEKTMSSIISHGRDREPNFKLELYHKYVSDAEHLNVIEQLKKLPLAADNTFPINVLDECMSKFFGFPVSSWNPKLELFACFIRIVRPQSTDNNPLHRDVWIDRLRHAINVYIPIAGSNSNSSLTLIPKSHLWRESEIVRTTDSCTASGVPFTVPGVVQSNQGLSTIRPVLKDNEILIFSPYLIHGGARNLNEDITRVSLEMRFWRKT